MTLEASPVTDILLPGGAEEHDDQQAFVRRIAVVDPPEPPGVPDSVSDELPDQPEPIGKSSASLDPDDAEEQKRDFARMSIDRV